MNSIFNQVILVLLGAIIVVGFSFNSFEDPDGKKLFETHKCDLCHSVSTMGIEAEKKTGKMAGGDLVGLAEKYKTDFIFQYIMKETELDGKAHKKPFKGTDEELQALVDWLLEQKAEE